MSTQFITQQSFIYNQYQGIKTETPLATKPKEIKSASTISTDEFISSSTNDVEIGELTTKTAPKYEVFENLRYFWHKNFAKTYKAEENRGVNKSNTTKEEICLAKYGKAVAEDIKTVGNCYTGVKHALWSAGVIQDYGDMPKGNAKNAISYFENNKEKFESLDVKPDDLKDLPAGRIIVYKNDNEPNGAGHICITNGNGQAMSDHTDNMKWLEAHGEGSNFKVYKLTSAWTYNPETKKLEFTPNQKNT